MSALARWEGTDEQFANLSGRSTSAVWQKRCKLGILPRSAREEGSKQVLRLLHQGVGLRQACEQTSITLAQADRALAGEGCAA